MTPRGLFFCSFDDACILAPEVWRNHDGKVKIGFCWNHAVQLGLREPLPVPVKPEKKVSLLNQLLADIAAGKIEEVIPPPREIRSAFIVDGKPNEVPF